MDPADDSPESVFAHLPAVTSAVGLLLGVVLLVAVTVAATWAASQRLRSLRLSGDE